MSLMSKNQLVNELYVCSKSLNNPYAPPEAVEYARRFIAAVEKDLGLTLEQILNDPDLLDPILENRANNYSPRFLAKLSKVVSSHNNLLGNHWDGGFDYMPEKDKSFCFVYGPFNSPRQITTSRVKSVNHVSDKLIEIATNNSIYRLELH